MTMLTWESADTDEPGDQNADSVLGDHAFWSLGPSGDDEWSVELIQRDDNLVETNDGIHLGHYPTQGAAKEAARKYENAHQPVRCPTDPILSNGVPHTIIGCGSTNVEQDESEPALWDCRDCGIWFNPDTEWREDMSKLYCFHADESFVDKDTKQYQIIRVVDGERGFVVVDTRPTLGDAVAEAATWNRDLGRTVDEVLNIRASSMAVSPPRPSANLIIVIGNPVSGLSFFGPFDSNEDVQSFVKQERLRTWWLAQLISPSTR